MLPFRRCKLGDFLSNEWLLIRADERPQSQEGEADNEYDFREGNHCLHSRIQLIQKGQFVVKVK